MTAPYEPLGREEGLTLGELRNQIDFDDEGFKQFCRGHDLIAKLDGKEMSDYSTAHKAWLWGHYKGLIGDDPRAPIPKLLICKTCGMERGPGPSSDPYDGCPDCGATY